MDETGNFTHRLREGDNLGPPLSFQEMHEYMQSIHSKGKGKGKAMEQPEVAAAFDSPAILEQDREEVGGGTAVQGKGKGYGEDIVMPSRQLLDAKGWMPNFSLAATNQQQQPPPQQQQQQP